MHIATVGIDDAGNDMGALAAAYFFVESAEN